MEDNGIRKMIIFKFCERMNELRDEDLFWVYEENRNGIFLKYFLLSEMILR